jgi:rhomboid protease GluP
MTYGIIAITSIVSLTALFSSEGNRIVEILALYKPAVHDGEYWRLWTVTLVHADILHLGFNMYALWIAGPLVEQIYGPVRMLLVYLAAALGGSVASYALNDGPLAVARPGRSSGCSESCSRRRGCTCRCSTGAAGRSSARSAS